MCIAILYFHEGQRVLARFGHPDAVLPVYTRSGGIRLLAWGEPRRQGVFPHGGWTRLDTLYAGDWDYWFPIPVQLPIHSYMYRDHRGRGQWTDPLIKGHVLQGLVARDGPQRRVYVVTLPPSEDAESPLQPRVVIRLSR
ncbi:uncharacterized protein FOKN1_1367 [Thiohalobacter thiocyanaticus]|uniref:Uncharacterized protein n=1 Tax=Thiohalobacter thiocyanaticus TaxID=585455 RepID=A0A1Z4VQK2_9GAMM|nr:uncharacterized protein FOKN1_1367 [Thiohalobacter thiocyanaticus]